jgi:tetratricopeptide (TPR) repeat protein
MKSILLVISLIYISLSFGQRELEKLESGIEKYYSEDYIGALEDFNLAIMINPNNIDAYINRAITLWEFKNYKGAIEDFSKAIELDPDNLNLHWYRGLAKESSCWPGDPTDFIESNYRGAIADFTKAIELEKKNIKTRNTTENDINYRLISEVFDAYSIENVYANRGYSKSKLNDFTGAIADYTKAIELGPNSEYIYYHYCDRAEAKNKLKNYVGAIADYSKAIELEPDYYSSYWDRAEAKKMLKNYVGAIADYSKAIELEPNGLTMFIYSQRADAKFKMLDYRGAIADYTEAIEREPVESEDNFLKRGDAKRLIKDKEGACLDYSKAGELGAKIAYERIKLYCK